MKTIISFFLQRRWILLSLCIVTPLGFWFKFHEGPSRWWFNLYGGGVMYEIFWCLLVLFIWPKKRNVTKIALWVFLVTCFLEILQLWHPWFLQQLRSTFLGKALLGTTFVWWDFPHYALGCLIGLVWMLGIVSLTNLPEQIQHNHEN